MTEPRFFFRDLIWKLPARFGGSRTRVTLICKECGHTARRVLMLEAGSHGTRETSSEPAYCPKGHGLMVRKDGVRQERWALWPRRP